MNNYLRPYKICSEYFKENRVYTNYNGFSTTETFNKDVLEGKYEINI